MGVYLVCLVVIIGLRPALCIVKLENRNKAYVICVSICLFLVLALRDYSVGIDLENYIPLYIYWGKIDWGNLWNARRECEYGYVLLNKLLYCISESPRLLLMFCAAVQMVCYGYSIYKESKEVQFSFIMFLTLGIFQGSASSLRQSTAACILMVAYQYIRERNIKRFVLLVMVAFSIHKSALIFLPLYFLYGIKMKAWIVLTAAVSYIVCLFFGSRILKEIIQFTGYTRYFSSDYSLSGEGEMGLLIMISALIVIFFIIYVGNYNVEFSFSMFILLVMELFIILTFYLGIVARIIKYFIFASTIAVPNLAVENRNKHNKSIVKIISCFVFFLYYVLVLAKSDMGQTFVYKFWWQ